MKYYIIYKQDSGNIAMIIPTEEALSAHTLQEIAVKDVPEGKAFKIVKESELPMDTPMEFWTINDKDLTDGIGGESYEFN